MLNFDVNRRPCFKSGAICSGFQNKGNCMYAIAQEFNPGDAAPFDGYTEPTKERKQWLFGALVGSGWKFVRIEVFQEDGALYAKAIDAKVDFSMPASDFDHNTGDGLIQDMSTLYFDATSGPEVPYANWETPKTVAGLNMGAVYYDLSGSMVPSLLGFHPLDGGKKKK